MQKPLLHRSHAIRGTLAGVLVLCLSASAEIPVGFGSLFNGEDLAGWRGGETLDPREFQAMPEDARRTKVERWATQLTEIDEDTGKPHWRVESGVLINGGKGSYLTTEREFSDFELLVDFKMSPTADSGIYLRGVPQVQIWNPTMEDPRYPERALGSGGLWNNAPDSPGRIPMVLADNPPGEWNHFRILMVGDRVSVWLNGHYVVDYAVLENYFDRKLPADLRRPVPKSGPIQLQTHGGEIRWRNLYIREIGVEEAKAIHASYMDGALSRRDAVPLQPNAVVDARQPGWVGLGKQDFVDVNGTDETWTWSEDLLLCTGLPIGVMRSKKEYSNFELMIEWRHMRLGGNSGVFVWVDGDALEGLEPDELPRGGIETQMLDHGYHRLHKERTGERGTFFTTHGDVFPVGTSAMTPFPPLSPNGKRSFPRENRVRGVGEWNHHYVRAVNGEVRLWVNGAEVSGGTDCNPQAGYLCLESEGSPVEFRNIRIREIP